MGILLEHLLAIVVGTVFRNAPNGILRIFLFATGIIFNFMNHVVKMFYFELVA